MTRTKQSNSPLYRVIDGSGDAEPWVGVRSTASGAYIENYKMWDELRRGGGFRRGERFGGQWWQYQSAAAARDVLALLQRHRDVEVASAADLEQQAAAALKAANAIAARTHVVRIPGEVIVAVGPHVQRLRQYVKALRADPDDGWFPELHRVAGTPVTWCDDPFGDSNPCPFVVEPAELVCHLNRVGLTIKDSWSDGLGGVVISALTAAEAIKPGHVVPLTEAARWADRARGLGATVIADFDLGDPWAAAAAEAHRVTSERATVVPGWAAPTADGLRLRDFQRAGVEFVLSHAGRAMIADEMGTGKTAQAIAAAQMMDAKRVLVVAPAAVRYVWRDEIPRWAPGVVQVLESGADVPDPAARWVVTSYGLISDRTVKDKSGKAKVAKSQQRQALLAWKPDLLVMDEAHHCKTAAAKRTLAVIELSESAPRVLGLTGTPIQNRTEEAATLASVIDPVSYAALREARVGIERCRNLLREVSIRRTKEDVLKELPPVSERATRLPGPIEFPDPQDLIKWEPPLLAVPKWATSIEDPDVRAFACRLPPNLKHVESMRAGLGEAKAASRVVLEYIQGIAEQEPVVVFTHHHGATDGLAKALAAKSLRVAVADGRKSAAARIKLVAQFQRGAFDVLIAGMEALGEGVTLTRAHQAVFVELPWKPATIQQARDRLHRIGQENPVNVTYFVAPHALDICLAAMIRSKADLVADVHVEEVRVLGETHVALTPESNDGDNDPSRASRPLLTAPTAGNLATPLESENGIDPLRGSDSCPLQAGPERAETAADESLVAGEDENSGDTAAEQELMDAVARLGAKRVATILKAAMEPAHRAAEPKATHTTQAPVRASGARRKGGRPALPPDERTRRRKASKKAWREKNHTYMREYMRKYRAHGPDA